MPGVAELEPATSDVTGYQNRKYAKFNVSFYAYKQRRTRHELTVGFVWIPIVIHRLVNP